MPIEQILVGQDNFCYVIYSKIKKQAIVIDPSYYAEKAIDFIEFNSLDLFYIILTHHHSDHTASTMDLKSKHPQAKIIMSKIDGGISRLQIDIEADEASTVTVDEITLTFLLTPGHTPGSICIQVNNEALITGDTLFINDCGRTDLSGGNLQDMFHSLQEKIMKLPDNLIVYPGHNYGNKPFDILGNQKKTNKTLLAKTVEELGRIP